jgi:ribosomal subunit interface protein
MEVPLTIDTHHASVPPELEELIRSKASSLERFYQPIIRCRVAVEGPGRRHRNGGPYGVRVDLTVPGAELRVDRQENEEMAVAIREALDAAKRQLQDHARLHRHDTKLHEPQPRGRVTEICPAEGYGFLETPDGREIYFHENSVLGPGFEGLGIGTEVRFVEELGEKGPQASTVEMVDRM